jgi:hypothetical protein
MKTVVAGLCLLSVATVVAAQENPRIKVPARETFYMRESVPDLIFARGSNPSYHNGPVIPVAKVVLIFWGPSFASGGADNAYAQSLQAFRNQFGTTGEYNVITQYYEIVGGVQTFISKSNLAAGTPDMFDTSTPPTNVTDANVQAEVQKYLTTHAFDASTIYEVVIPPSSYSSDGGSDSCGGPSLAYCAYHSWIGSGASAIKYSIEPYPSCSGCQWPGWTNAQNGDHFICHETREAVTDPVGTGWWNSRNGEELDDQCAWSPSPFLVGVYGYQYEWSNANSGCVQSR